MECLDSYNVVKCLWRFTMYDIAIVFHSAKITQNPFPNNITSDLYHINKDLFMQCIGSKDYFCQNLIIKQVHKVK